MRRSAHLVQQLYRHTAPRYESAIAPVMRPLAQSLVRTAAIHPTDTVLDIGTGTGVLVRELAGLPATIIGVDATLAMLRIARRLRPFRSRSRVYFVLSDANHLSGLADACCDVAFASFGLGDCQPRQALPAVARVLRPGGRLYLQEWGPTDGATDPRAIVDEMLADFVTETAQGLRLSFRQHLAEPRPWDQQLQDADDYAEALAEAGFGAVQAAERRPVTVTFQPGVERFLAYALAWAPRHLELRAMPAATRQAFHAAVTRRLMPLLDPDGALRWRPAIFYAHGVKEI